MVNIYVQHICTYRQVASVGFPAFGRKALAGIRSALFFAEKRPLRFHLVVDGLGEQDVKEALKEMGCGMGDAILWFNMGLM
jgi:hypothetical protein